MTTNRQREWSYTRAVQQVGDTPERQLMWLLRFADAGLDDEIRSELDAFFTVRMLRHIGGDDSGPARFTMPVGERLPDLAPRIQSEMRQQLARLRSDGECAFTVPARVQVNWNNPSVRKGTPWSMTSWRTAAPLALFFGEVLDLLLEVNDRLRICAAEGCAKMFVATRPHQVHCGPTCTNRATQARRRAKIGAEKVAEERRIQRKKRWRGQRAAAAGIAANRVDTFKKKR